MRKSRLSWYRQKRLIELFVAGTTARTTSSLVGVNKTTAIFIDFGGDELKVNEVELLQGKSLYLDF